MGDGFLRFHWLQMNSRGLRGLVGLWRLRAGLSGVAWLWGLKGYEISRCIVCLNEPKFCTHVRLDMTNNVVPGSFQLYYTKKSFSIFRMPQKFGFVKHLPIICCKTIKIYFVKKIEQVLNK